MVQVTFKINGNTYSAGPEVGPECTLVHYIRHHALLLGTKWMCSEGGCGVCVVHVKYKDPNTKKDIMKSMNSCMIPIFACDGWEITTVEGLGNKSKGYHSIQKRLAQYNGTQCGFCSPGMVMNMYGILASDPKPTQQRIEDAFDGNICRCTGYRSILKAMRSFAVDQDGNREEKDEIPDIEEMNKACCGKKGYTMCNNSCKSGVSDADYEIVANGEAKTIESDLGVWHKPETLKDLRSVMQSTMKANVRYIVGNTGMGVFKFDGPYDHFIDMKYVPELYEITNTDDKIEIGANITLTEMIDVFREKAKPKEANTQNSLWNYFSAAAPENSGWEYCEALAHHISYIANVPVRNAASWAGNLQMKHDHIDFPSDVFLILETAGATVTVGSYDGTTKENIKISDFVTMNTDGKILQKLTLKKLTSNHTMRSFKITIRAVNSHAYINAGFMFEISKSDGYKVKSKPAIVFGGVNKDFIHAKKTEDLLNGANLNDAETIKKALTTLESEIVPNADPGMASVTYRKSLCVSLMYKYLLGVLGKDLPAKYQSGGPNLVRPLSSGKQSYYTNEEDWPVSKPVLKLEADIQCSGEARYSGDQEPLSGQLYAAFVVSKQACATISKIDATKAKKLSGVVKFLTHEDIPGVNNFVATVGFPMKEELLSSGKVDYAGQPIGIILAEDRLVAEKAARMVEVEYTGIKKPIVTVNEAIDKKYFWPHSMDDAVIAGNVEEGFKDSDHVIDGELLLGGQYHFYLETHSTSCVPTDMGLEIQSATQLVNHCQGAIASVLNIASNEVNVQVKRLGGAFGGKISRSFPTAVACALGCHLTNRPVVMHLPMDTNMEHVGKRLPYLAKFKVGFTSEGKLQAVEMFFYDDSGSTYNEQYGTTAVTYGDNVYFCKNWKIVPITCRTDTPANTSCRGPAWLQGVSFIEEVMENVARYLGLSALDVKMLNLIENGQKSATGAVMNNCLIKQMVQPFREMSNFDVRRLDILEFNKKNLWKKKGLACAMMKFPLAYFGIKFNAMVSIYAHDGTVAVTHGGIEVGQGVNTKVAQACAYELQIDLSLVKIKATNSLTAPNNTETGGDVGADLNTWAVVKACQILNKRMAPIKKKMKNPTWLELVKECEKNNMDLCARNEYSPKDIPSEYNIYGITATEVEVDVLTGVVQVPRVDILYDAGQSISPFIDIGQLEGGYVMGLGLMLHEQLRYHPETGELLTKNTWEYKPPTAKDIPIYFNVQFMKNVTNPLGVLRAKACGEPPLCMSCSALFAVRDAVQSARADAGKTDRMALNVPATPEYVHDACLISVDRMKIH